MNKNPTLKFIEMVVHGFTYLLYTLFGLLVSALLGPKINKIVEQEVHVNYKNLNCIEKYYGETNPAYALAGNMLEFTSAFIPSKVTIIIFIGVAYLIYIFLVDHINTKKIKRHTFIVYLARAFGSIGTGAYSLVYFITAFLCLSYAFLIIFVGECLQGMKNDIAIMTIFYLFLSCFIFFNADKIDKINEY